MEKKAYQTCIEMFQQRGYEITEMDDNNKIVAIDDKNETVCVFICDAEKFNVSKVQEYIVLMNSLDIKHCLIVYYDITPAAKKVIEDYKEINIELFHISSLQFNITKHRLNPKFEALTPEETLEFKKRFGINIAVMLFGDPISKFYGFKRGTIIRVIRQDSIGYRIVR
jgi:DNA-directed RNA polymerase I, II, and III subunit RPABC1